MIDPNKTYRTRDGRPVRIYATDGGHDGEMIHGAIWCGIDGWISWQWKSRNMQSARGGFGMDLVEVTLADELRDQIPWEALRPEVKWVAYHPSWGWVYLDTEEKPKWSGTGWLGMKGSQWQPLGPIVMPEVDHDRWAEALIARPEDK